MVLDVELPDYAVLINAFRKRNNIVHRYSMSNMDRITITNATLRDIITLADDMDVFLSALESCIQD